MADLETNTDKNDPNFQAVTGTGTPDIQVDPDAIKRDFLDKVAHYKPDIDLQIMGNAVDFCIEYHAEQKRSSGEPYYTHPIAVAEILLEMQMDAATLITALLHDTVEDTDATLNDISKNFGDEVSKLVDGVTKLTRIELQSLETKQAENFRKLVLAMSEDIRVLIVKLADRTHNMGTLHHISKPHKRHRIASETLEIFAPLAERIGIHTLKERLEDFSFEHLQPEARASILKRLSFLKSEGQDVVKNILSILNSDMKDAAIDAKISGREKTPYSIWRKMQRKNVTFEQLSDIMAFRVVVKDIGECYHVLGVLHGKYPVVPGRFKDYISTPKLNGYRSLHTTVLGPENQKIEIQIRTEEMHQEAELGVAAHWAYKQGSKSNRSDAQQYRWLRELLDILENAGQPDEFLENTKLELFQDRVFCFSPKGDLIELPSGATPIDFAYAVHSAVGDTCVGAKINGRIAPLNTKLHNGDQVDIQTSKTQTPSPAWERFVVTGKAKSRIRRFIRQQQRDEYIQLGKTMLEKKFRQEGYKFTEKAVSGVLKILNVDNIEDLYAGAGSGHLAIRDIFAAIFPDHNKTPSSPDDDFATVEAGIEKVNNASANAQNKKQQNREKVPIKGLIPGMAMHFARCCHPLPGDRIVGIVTTGRGVTIHTIDCETLENFADTPERWLDVAWQDGPDAPESHIGRLSITLGNEAGALGTLSSVIGSNGGNITNLKILNRDLDFWDMTIDVYVEDVVHLNNIIAALRATPEIISVDRAKGK